jgi:hypothetical protein
MDEGVDRDENRPFDQRGRVMATLAYAAAIVLVAAIVAGAMT